MSDAAGTESDPQLSGAVPPPPPPPPPPAGVIPPTPPPPPAGVTPPLYVSGNVEGADERNEHLIDEYRDRIGYAG